MMRQKEESMPVVSVVIPNYNGLRFLQECFFSLQQQTLTDYEVILVDNGSSDESVGYTRVHFPEVRIVQLPENLGFCRAVNEGIRQSEAPFVVLLNNDTAVEPDFLEELMAAIKRHPKAFSCASRMVRYDERDQLDDAGNFYCALGWAYARGKGKKVDRYQKEERIFAACAGAAIYRKAVFEKIGYFDEEHFAYLEDIDIGYRARIFGYENWYAPKAVVYHVGSGTSGSRYNQFKIRYSSRNSIYLIWKNMPLWQIVLNLPLLTAGFGIKLLFFTVKGMGLEYLAGIKNGFQISKKNGKLRAGSGHFFRYLQIQLELWINLIRRFC